MNCNCDCQLIAIYNASLNLNIFDKTWLLFKRIYLSLVRRSKNIIPSVKNKFFDRTDFRSNHIEPPKDISHRSPLQEGDMVQILSFNEIRKTLNKDNLTQGLYFMPEMKKYCGTTRKVLKRVNCMFDERSWKMIKTKNVVLLEGIICDGKDMLEKEGCARSCFWFWKEAWLRKI